MVHIQTDDVYFAYIGSEDYHVTVATDPEEGPFQLESYVTLSCLVDPLPPDPITYTWHASDAYIYSESTESPNATIYIRERNYRFSRIFCYVHSNSTRVGVGSIIVEAEGM